MEQPDSLQPESLVNDAYSREGYSCSNYSDEDEYNAYFDTMDSVSVVSSVVNKKKSHQINKGENGLYSLIVRTKGTRKPTIISFYTTRCVPGAKIRNAVDGIYENHRVGKKEEDLYFKVRMATGQFSYGNDLYYHSPEQYEKHFSMKLDERMKTKWLEKYRIAKNRLLENQQQIIKPDCIVVK